MRTRGRLVPLVLALSAPLAAAPVVPKKTFDAIAAELSGERAQENVREIVRFHRIQGSPMMAAVATHVLARLKEAGLEASIEEFPSDGATSYGTHLSPMGWDMRGGELWVEGDVPLRLCRYEDVPMCVSSYSKGGEIRGPLVEVGAGTSAKDYEGKDVKGKVVLAFGYAGNVIREAAVKRGAVAAVIYPAADDRPNHPDMIRYNGIWPRASELATTAPSFQISTNQYAALKARMRSGEVVVRGRVDATLGPGKLTLVHAWIRGTEEPAREVLITAHLDHPKWSANDNASGSGAVLEMARTLKTLVAKKALPAPRRTLHFMWVPEYFGTLAWASKHPEARKCDADRGKACILANLNLDMVGEDTVKTASRFYFTKAPASVPSFLDALLGDTLEETRDAGLLAPTGTRNFWPAEAIPYAQGSDHDVLLGLGVPATMLGHDPDWTHHTSEDTVDKTDASELLRASAFASAAAWWLATAAPEDWAVLAPRVVAARLAGESARLAEAKGAARAELARRVERDAALLTAPPRAASSPEDLTPSLQLMAPSPKGTGPRLATLLPLDASALENLSKEDAAWRDEELVHLPMADPHGGLPIGLTWDSLVFEAMVLMDGRRTPAEIAALLNAGLGVELDAGFVSRLARILADRKLVAMP
jgi:Zn-dependent M28 family amino/carboxypeptidase